MELDLTGVKAKFLQDAFEANLIRCQVNVVLLQRSNNLRSTNTAVEVSFFVGVGFDGNAGIAVAFYPVENQKLRLTGLSFLV